MTKVIKDVFQDYKKDGNILEAEILKMNLFKKSNKLEIELVSQNQLKIKELADFECYLSTRFAIKTIELAVRYSGVAVNCTLEDDWKDVIKYIAFKFPITKAILKNSTVSLNDKNVIIDLKNKNSAFLHSYSVDKVLENLFFNVYGERFKVTYNEDVTDEEIEEQQHLLEEIQDSLCKNLVNTINEAAQEKKKAKEQERDNEEVGDGEEEPEEEQTPLIVGRSANIKEQLVKISDLTQDYGKVAIQGKVIKTESREIKKGRTIVRFDVYDGTSTITCKSFVDNEKVPKVMSRIQPGIRVKLEGNARV